MSAIEERYVNYIYDTAKWRKLCGSFVSTNIKEIESISRRSFVISYFYLFSP